LLPQNCARSTEQNHEIVDIARNTEGAFHLVTQVNTNIILSFLTFNKKQRTIFVSTCVTKWKDLEKRGHNCIIYRVIRGHGYKV